MRGASVARPEDVLIRLATAPLPPGWNGACVREARLSVAALEQADDVRQQPRLANTCAAGEEHLQGSVRRAGGGRVDERARPRQRTFLRSSTSASTRFCSSLSVHADVGSSSPPFGRLASLKWLAATLAPSSPPPTKPPPYVSSMTQSSSSSGAGRLPAPAAHPSPEAIRRAAARHARVQASTPPPEGPPPKRSNSALCRHERTRRTHTTRHAYDACHHATHRAPRGALGEAQHQLHALQVAMFDAGGASDQTSPSHQLLCPHALRSSSGAHVVRRSCGARA